MRTVGCFHLLFAIALLRNVCFAEPGGNMLGLGKKPKAPRGATLAIADFQFKGNKDRSKTLKAAVRDPQYHELPVMPDRMEGTVDLVCPDRFHLVGSMCRLEEYADPVASCPYGSSRGSSVEWCVQVDSTPPVRVCPAGFEQYLKGCIRRFSISAIRSCPESFEPFEGICIKRRDFPARVECPEGHRLEASQCVHRTTAPAVRDGCGSPCSCKGGKKKGASRAVPHTSTACHCHEKCTSGTWLCPEGLSLLELPDPPLCESTQRVPPTTSCPEGIEPTDSGTCEALLTAPIHYSCPKSYHVGYQSKIARARNEKCEIVEFAPHQPTCPRGYSRRHHKNANPRACVAEKRLPATLVCPPGFLWEDASERCMKRIELAPSLDDDSGRLSACKRSGGSDGISCGLQSKYFAAVKD